MGQEGRQQTSERIQKVLAHAGIASRRAAEEMIRAGRIRVNGGTATIGQPIDASSDVVEVDGSKIELSAELLRYLLINKPRGMVSTLRDPQRRPTIKDLLAGVPQRLYPAGRLDYDSQGLILCTNDGALANTLMHPRHAIWKTYVARVEGVPVRDELQRLEGGVLLDGRRTLPARFRILPSGNAAGGTTLLEVRLREGRQQQIRRMLEQAGYPVISLERTAIGPIKDPQLAAGGRRDLTDDEVELLKRAAGKEREKD